MRKSDNNDKSKEISPETNIETISDNEAQRRNVEINSGFNLKGAWVQWMIMTYNIKGF